MTQLPPCGGDPIPDPRTVRRSVPQASPIYEAYIRVGEIKDDDDIYPAALCVVGDPCLCDPVEPGGTRDLIEIERVRGILKKCFSQICAEDEGKINVRFDIEG